MYTLKDIAQMTQLTTRTLQNHLKEGVLKGRKIGRSWRFSEEDLKNYLGQGETYDALHLKSKDQIHDFLSQNTEGVLTVLRLPVSPKENLSEAIVSFIKQNISDGLFTFKAMPSKDQMFLELTIIATLERTNQLTGFIQNQIGGSR